MLVQRRFMCLLFLLALVLSRSIDKLVESRLKKEIGASEEVRYADVQPQCRTYAKRYLHECVFAKKKKKGSQRKCDTMLDSYLWLCSKSANEAVLRMRAATRRKRS